MKDKELLIQLKSLRSLKLNDDWKDVNRRVLRSQIYSGQTEDQNLNFWAKFNVAFSRLSEPYAVAAMILLFFVTSGVGSVLASKSSQPGEILYNAKIISERTKYVLARSEQSKTKLNLEFAKERMSELTVALDDKVKIDEPKVATLKTDFKKEISAAREKISKLQPAIVKTVIDKPIVVEIENNKTALTISTVSKTTNKTVTDFKSATNNKDDKRIDISIPLTPSAKIEAVTTSAAALDEAELLFDKADYTAAKEALEKVNVLLDGETK